MKIIKDAWYMWDIWKGEENKAHKQIILYDGKSRVEELSLYRR